MGVKRSEIPHVALSVITVTCHCVVVSLRTDDQFLRPTEYLNA